MSVKESPVKEILNDFCHLTRIYYGKKIKTLEDDAKYYDRLAVIVNNQSVSILDIIRAINSTFSGYFIDEYPESYVRFSRKWHKYVKKNISNRTLTFCQNFLQYKGLANNQKTEKILKKSFLDLMLQKSRHTSLSEIILAIVFCLYFI